MKIWTSRNMHHISANSKRTQGHFSTILRRLCRFLWIKIGVFRPLVNFYLERSWNPKRELMGPRFLRTNYWSNWKSYRLVNWTISTKILWQSFNLSAESAGNSYSTRSSRAKTSKGSCPMLRSPCMRGKMVLGFLLPSLSKCSSSDNQEGKTPLRYRILTMWK